MSEPIELDIKAALDNAAGMFKDSDSSRLDAELLLCSVLGKARNYLYTWPEQLLNKSQQELFHRHCLRRVKGYPIAYLIGQRAFWNFDLKVNAQVLIPRPETELLVELALERLGDQASLVADLGTGSGAIALSFASERVNARVLACDISSEALKVATSNADQLKILNIDFKHGYWCDAFEETELDAILANPPYIDEQDEHLGLGDVRFEPLQALVSADKGLADIKVIASQSGKKLKHEGWLMLEHGYQQGQQVREILLAQAFSRVETFKDMAGNERVTIGCYL